jgi:hypothetical protein
MMRRVVPDIPFLLITLDTIQGDRHFLVLNTFC